MAKQVTSTQELRVYARFIDEVQIAIRDTNRTIIGERISDLTKQRFCDLAVSVARLRARYLEVVLGTDWNQETLDIREIRDRRELYEEALKAFEALERLIERGYVRIAPGGPG